LKRFLIWYVLSVIVSTGRSQTLQTTTNSYIKTTTYSSVHKDAFSFLSNQAVLANIKSMSVGVFGERRFLLEDMSSYQMAFTLPTSSGNFGLKANYFGSTSFNESELGLAYARNLGRIDAGIQFNYFAIQTTGYGKASAVNFEAGALLHVTDQFETGIHIYNPTRAGIGKNNEERLPFIYSFGLGYDASEKFFIGTEIEKIEDRPVNINAGLHYSFDEKLFVRTGIASATSSFYLGFGFLLNGFRIDVTASLHPNLGMSPGILLLYYSPLKE
jgi:hypothetical protein